MAKIEGARWAPAMREPRQRRSKASYERMLSQFAMAREAAASLGAASEHRVRGWPMAPG